MSQPWIFKWRCSECGSRNPILRSQCRQCGADRRFFVGRPKPRVRLAGRP